MQIKTHNTCFSNFQNEEPDLFSDQLYFATWLVVLLCKNEHWKLVADLSKVEIHLYNSLGYLNNRYYRLHAITIE
jgi:hypothetical protein